MNRVLVHTAQSRMSYPKITKQFAMRSAKVLQCTARIVRDERKFIGASASIFSAAGRRQKTRAAEAALVRIHSDETVTLTNLYCFGVPRESRSPPD
jgi:hypothetical protein